MWVFVLSRKITGAFTREQELNALNADFPKNVFKHVGKTRALVMVPVDDYVVEEIQILVDNPNFIPGSAKLAWFQEDLREDILRTIEENEAKEFQVGDIVRIREWKGRVNGITWQTNDNGRNMADSIGNEYPITKIEYGDGRVNNWWIPLSQLDLVRRPSSEPAPAAASDSPQQP